MSVHRKKCRFKFRELNKKNWIERLLSWRLLWCRMTRVITSVGRRNPTGRMTIPSNKMKRLTLLFLVGCFCCCIGGAMSQRTGKRRWLFLYHFCFFVVVGSFRDDVFWPLTNARHGAPLVLEPPTLKFFSCRNRSFSSSFFTIITHGRYYNVDHTPNMATD